MLFIQTKLSDANLKSDWIIAAGGIVWRRGLLCCPKVAIIHRSRYGDWCLPKGKPDPKKRETLGETALREVREETGCKARITSFAGETRYTVEGKTKVVYFFNMAVNGECTFRPSEEVDQVLWMSPQEAIKRLDHREEKNLLSNPYFGRGICSRFSISRLLRFINFRRYNRLAGSLRAFRIEAKRRIGSYKEKYKTDPCWGRAIRELLDSAESALLKCDIDEGWKCFHAAQRMEIFGLSEAELKLKATLLRQESEKLSSWRKQSTVDLIGTTDSPKTDLSYEHVYQAALLRDDHFNNQAYKDGMLRTHMLTLSVLLAIIIATLISLIKMDLIPLSQNTIVSDWWMFTIVILFGLFGGTFSAALKVPSSTKSTRIPELVHTIRLTLLRIFAGAASALIIFIFIQSQFVDGLVNVDVSNLEPYTYFAISFAAGFSERLVLKAVELVTKEK